MLLLFDKFLFWVFLLYALSFFAVAGIIIASGRRAADNPALRAFLILAGFAGTHGLAELLDWVRFVLVTLNQPAPEWIRAAAQGLCLVSFVMLLQFALAVREIINVGTRLYRLVPAALFLVFLAAMRALGVTELADLALFGRYAFGFTGAALSAYSLYKFGESVQPLEDVKLNRGVGLIAAGFAAYAVFGGLVVTPLAGIPIQAFRAACAGTVALGSISVVASFKYMKPDSAESV
jgi:hypothetical protein